MHKHIMVADLDGALYNITKIHEFYKSGHKKWHGYTIKCGGYWYSMSDVKTAEACLNSITEQMRQDLIKRLLNE